jgi:hypothetical protein
VNYFNVTRAIRASAPGSFEIRTSASGNVYSKGATSDNRDHVLNALMKTDSPDWQTVWRERQLAVKQLREDGNENPVVSFDNAILSKAPFRAVLGKAATLSERNQIIANMTDEDKALLRVVEQRLQHYAAAVGRSLNLVEGMDMPKQPAPPRPSGGRFGVGVGQPIGAGNSFSVRGANPFLNSSERSRLARPAVR